MNQVYFSPGPDCRIAIEQAIETALDELLICVFTISDDRLSDAIQRAHRNGLTVRVLSDNDKMDDRGNDIERLAASGVDVRIDRSPEHMHHKFMVVDGQTVLTGSYNWTRSAETRNEENLVVLDDPFLAGRFAEEFERIWNISDPVLP
jgi:cardiolipin hydrolase